MVRPNSTKVVMVNVPGLSRVIQFGRAISLNSYAGVDDFVAAATWKGILNSPVVDCKT